MDEEKLLGELRKRRENDFSYEDGRVLSAVYTKPLRVAVKAFELFMDTNALDSHIFPEVSRMEKEILLWFSSLLKKKGLDGYVSTGGTESNFVALWAARKKYPDRDELIVPESAHYSIHKAADMMDLKVRNVSLDEDFKADVSKIKSLISEDTLAVVATAGTSAMGVVDPIEKISRLCDDVFFHVDAAFGGFVLPFLENAQKIDFSLENLDSVSIDPHKMGLCPIPAGLSLFRDSSYLEKMMTSPSYLPVRSPTLCGSRSGGAVAATWAAINHLGVEGYKKVVGECMKNTLLLCEELERVGVDILVEPELNFIAIRPHEIERVYGEMLGRGWSLVFDSETRSVRIVVMPHVTREVIKDFVSDLEDVI